MGRMMEWMVDLIMERVEGWKVELKKMEMERERERGEGVIEEEVGIEIWGCSRGNGR